MDIEKLSKKELQERVRQLQSLANETACETNNCAVLHELHVHQLELEMQNRELRETQQLLEETRDRYADLYDFAPVSYISFDIKGIIANINLTGAFMLGEVRSNIINKPFSLWLDTSSLSLFYKHIVTTLGSDSKVQGEFTIKRTDGRIFNVRIESIRSKELSIGCYHCRSVIIDITESKRINDEILLQSRQLRLITDALPVMIAYLDNNERHLFSNKIYNITFNVFPTFKQQSAKAVWGNEIYANVKKYLKLAMIGHPVTFDMEVPAKDAKNKYFNTTLIPDWDSNEQVHGVIVLIGDITDRLVIEEIDRQRLLDVAHFSRLSSMGEMASEIAHELNQPLAAISTYSDACRRLISSGKTNQHQIIETLANIAEQAERAGMVIKKIREFVTKQDLDIIKININDLVGDAIRLLAVEIRSYAVKLIIDTPDNIPDILLDKILIEQVIFNLIRNALEAMSDVKQGERLLHITTEYIEPGEIKLIVDDSGPGLSDEKLKYMFHAFHTTKKDGMGMGLAISHSIIRAHHGNLQAGSNQYGGASFSFTLPVLS